MATKISRWLQKIGEGYTDKNSEERTVFTAEDTNSHMAGIIRRAALPVNCGELIAHQIERAARRLQIPRGLAKRIWYGEQRVVPAHIALNLIEFDRQSAELRERLTALQAELDALGKQ